MKKIVLIDGNNFMFRSYYATAYNGNVMRNSKNFPTNALYGFVGMLNKIIEEENPKYMLVAFDIGKNFRKQEYDFYKEGRSETPDELKMQMPVARKILDAMGIKYLELEPYEADDIIGTLVKKIEENQDFDATIVSSDKDLLQLINFETDVKLLKTSGFIRYNEKTFEEAYGIKPINMIDLKALMGDSSDNIPGVKGIGEKTALKLLHDYKTLDGIYENIDLIKGSLHEKLINGKNDAYMSYKIATIYKDVPIDINLNDLKYNNESSNELIEIYNDLEFYSLLKNMKKEKEETSIKYINVNENINVVLEKDVALFIECDNEVYTRANIIGGAVCDSKYNYYFDKENIKKLPEILKDKNIFTYDHKKNLYLVENLPNAVDDIMISSYLLGYNTKDDIAYLASTMGYSIEYYENILKENNLEKIKQNIVQKTRFIYENVNIFNEKLSNLEMFDLYQNIEMKLIRVLHNMEKNGIEISKDELDKLGEEIEKKLSEVTKKIYEMAGENFNIASPKQLGSILFDKLNITKGIKGKTGAYKTDVDTLERLKDAHPIIKEILEYRELAKIKSTYIEGLIKCINSDNKIHTIFKQTVVRTGRLSSVEPNLQNIPVKEGIGRNIRKAFFPDNDMFLSCDYSQIELRVLSSIADCKKMIETFKNEGDIHATVASDINNVPLSEVTKEMRSNAKAVIFGIVYGISGYGLGDNLHISKQKADEFIEKYYEMYPEVKVYMEKEVEFAKENGFVKTMFNRIRIVDEINNKNYMIREAGKRIAINSPIQGTAADIIKLAMIKVVEEFEKENIQSKLVLQVHDELIFDVIKEEEEKVKRVVKKVMENIVDLKVPLKVSSDTGKNLYDTK